MTWLLVVAGAAVGALLRYLIDRVMQAAHDTVFPWGTLTANLTGCAVLGVIAGLTTAGAADSPLQVLLGVGLCGALTTYSTLSYETLTLAQTGARFYAAINVVASLATGLGAVFIGTAIAQALEV